MALENSNVWINRSKSEKGFYIRFKGEMYTGAISTLKKFVDGEIDGVSLSKIVNEED